MRCHSASRICAGYLHQNFGTAISVSSDEHIVSSENKANDQYILSKLDSARSAREFLFLYSFYSSAFLREWETVAQSWLAAADWLIVARSGVSEWQGRWLGLLPYLTEVTQTDAQSATVMSQLCGAVDAVSAERASEIFAEAAEEWETVAAAIRSGSRTLEVVRAISRMIGRAARTTAKGTATAQESAAKQAAEVWEKAAVAWESNARSIGRERVPTVVDPGYIVVRTSPLNQWLLRSCNVELRTLGFGLFFCAAVFCFCMLR